jgi:hypothetical protein
MKEVLFALPEERAKLLAEHFSLPLYKVLRNANIAPGHCFCGCEQITSVAKYNFPDRHWVKGESQRYLSSHGGIRPLSDLIDLQRNYIEINNNGCWNWQAAKCKLGYGRLTVKGKAFLAHRVVYMLQYGIIDGKKVLDHTCVNPSCVNPDHLDLVTQQVNIKRYIERSDEPTVEDQLEYANKWRAHYKALFPDDYWAEHTDGCWVWLKRMHPNGYGRTKLGMTDGRVTPHGAHRYIYELLYGKIKKELVLHHTCRHRICVNPAHLEPVTQSENIKARWGR